MPWEDDKVTVQSCVRAFAVALGLSTVALSIGGGAFAQSFAPVAIVNDQIITGYDVEQRALLNSATSGGAADKAGALESLIEDTLRLQAARKAGIDPSPEQIRAGFREIARLNNVDATQMQSQLLSQGVTAEALNEQIKSEVAWRQFIIRRFGPRARVSDNEIDEAMGPESDAQPGEPEYLLAEIRFPIGAEGEAAAMAAARQAISELTSGTRFSDVARKVSTAQSASRGGDLGWVPRSKLSPRAASVVGAMNVDRVSPPFVDGSEVVLYGLRGTREVGGGSEVRYKLAQLVVGLLPGAPQSEADAALARANAVRSEIGTCNDVIARAPQYLGISGDLGELTLASMPGPVREAVAGLDVGQITQPVRSNDGFHVIAVCDKTQSGPSGEAKREQAENALRAQRLDRYARSYLRELKREAVIDRR